MLPRIYVAPLGFELNYKYRLAGLLVGWLAGWLTQHALHHVYKQTLICIRISNYYVNVSFI